MRARPYFVPILFALIFFSCGSKDVKKAKRNDVSFTVDWNKVDAKPVPKIEETQATFVGPAPLGKELLFSKSSKETKKPSALILGAGVYRTLSHITLLKELRLKGEEPVVIIGHGLASIIAAYYAFGYEPDYIEWKFFKFLNELDNDQPYTKEWLQAAQIKLLDEFKNKRIEEGKLTLIIPVKDLENGKVMYKKRGSLLPYLKANIDLNGYLSKRFRPAFTDSFVDKKTLTKIGIRRVLGVDLLTKGLSWKLGSGLLNGVFEKGATVTLNSEEKLDIMLVYPLSKYKVDDKKDIASLVFESKNIAREMLGKIQANSN